MNNENDREREGVIDEETLREYFPAIYKDIKITEAELEEENQRTKSGSKKIRKFRGYEPTIIDFICRCNTNDEAEEIITFMFKRGEISNTEREQLLKKLKEEGLESFGPHRGPGYYEKA